MCFNAMQIGVYMRVKRYRMGKWRTKKRFNNSRRKKIEKEKMSRGEIEENFSLHDDESTGKGNRAGYESSNEEKKNLSVIVCCVGCRHCIITRTFTMYI